ncbi:major facilitator superfamily domain-containing protein [Stachybotrys elegans]|uniref:Major facilitator superfamily domain-containing protein n=1 Tax=Stachybotrys elegans TaxID=80388 RepID=A0A8K0SXF7_9HYPO|nr:major facilitator superfamily domain-containing protein [Stachybotrys elegans]
MLSDPTKSGATSSASSILEKQEPTSEPSPVPLVLPTHGFDHNDPRNPYNFSKAKKGLIVLVGVATVINNTFTSALPANASPHIAKDFGISTDPSNVQLILPVSIYLVGFIFGPLLFGPLSEVYGRQYPMLATFGGYTLSILGCVLAPEWTIFLIFRFLGGMFGSAPLTIVGGLFADIYNDPITRGRIMSMFTSAVVCGPLLAPTLSGFVSESTSWRWSFWAALILAGVTWVPLMFLPETYAPVLLARYGGNVSKAVEKSGTVGKTKGTDWKHLAGVVLMRPLHMLCSEMIVAASCLYLAMVYAIFYMYFQAYPLVFKGIYKLSPGVSGLMFLPIVAGVFIGLAVALLYDAYLNRCRKAGMEWTLNEENRRLPIVCLGGPLYVIALLWLGWASRSDVPWVVPALAGIPAGMGTLLIFIGLFNYLGDAYKSFSASAMAASGCTRSIFGAILPLATTPMYQNLGIGWASTLLAGMTLPMCAVPFLLLRYGDAIRANSPFCQMLKETQLDSSRTLAGPG